MMVVAEVTTTPMKEKRVIEGGRPSAWPRTWAFWLLAYRVKSGILSDRVAQKPTMPVRAGTKKAQKAEGVANFAGCARTGPRPPWTWERAQYKSARAASGRKKA